jgi:hypothetical protein
MAALSGSALTAIAMMLVERQRARNGRRDTLDSGRLDSYANVLTRSGLIAMTAETLRVTMQVRSGLAEAVNVAVRLRQPIEPFDLEERMRADFEPLWSAMARISVIGTPAAIAEAGRVVEAAAELLHEATARGDAGSPLARAIRGERWTAEQLSALERRRSDLAAARCAFANVARAELGSEPFDWSVNSVAVGA